MKKGVNTLSLAQYFPTLTYTFSACILWLECIGGSTVAFLSSSQGRPDPWKLYWTKEPCSIIDPPLRMVSLMIGWKNMHISFPKEVAEKVTDFSRHCQPFCLNKNMKDERIHWYLKLSHSYFICYYVSSSSFRLCKLKTMASFTESIHLIFGFPFFQYPGSCQNWNEVVCFDVGH